MASLARDRPDFQRIVPHWGIDENAKTVFQDEFLRRLQALVEETSLDTLAGRRFRALADGQAQAWPGRFSDLLRIDQMTPDTILKARPGVITCLEDDGQSLRIHFAGNCLTVLGFLGGALKRAISGAPLSIRHIEGMMSA